MDPANNLKRSADDILDVSSNKKRVLNITTTTTITAPLENDGEGTNFSSFTSISNGGQKLSSSTDKATLSLVLKQLDIVREQLLKEAGEDGTSAPHSGSSSYVLPRSTQPQQQTRYSPYQPIVDGEGSVMQERGTIYFFYRPKVDVEEARNFNDIQRMYILLKGTQRGSQQRPLYRLIRIGKKKMPSIKEHNRFWGIVEEATEDVAKIRQLLAGGSYNTVTQGERVIHPCVAVGEGSYGLLTHHNSTHLAYILSAPEELGEVQQNLNIVREGSFYLTVKNPAVDNDGNADNNISLARIVAASPASGAAATGATPNAAAIALGQQTTTVVTSKPTSEQVRDLVGLPNTRVVSPGTLPTSPVRVDLPRELQESFRGRRWASDVPLEVLSYKGLEIILIGETDKADPELHKQLLPSSTTSIEYDQQHEQQGHAQQQLKRLREDKLKEVFAQLNSERVAPPDEEEDVPLTSWKRK